jgi:GTP-binding protein LepA
LQALIFDSWFDPYRGVIILARIFQGTMRKGMKVRLWWNGKTLDVETLGVLTPKPVEVDELVAGEVGFMIANNKNVADTKIGDTITEDGRPSLEPRYVKPWKNCG